MARHSLLSRLIRQTSKALVLVLAVGLSSACDEEQPTNGDGSAGAGGASRGGSSNLGKYADDPCALLPEEAVRAEIPDMPETVAHSKGTKSLKFCQFSWKGGRKASREVMGRRIEYDVDNTVCLRWIRKMKGSDPVARFKNSYKTMTQEEKAQAEETFKRVLEKKAGDLSEGGKKMGEDLGGAMLKGMRFEAVSGVGTAAAWGGTMGSYGLKVLDRDMEFEISVNISDDEAKNREASVRLAKKILARAK